ncbi:hypothetical protein KFL_001720040 [Klebsormidium nitens]|uniref:Expansin-like EG45 domain-containing protein n=1 Tax=Klebsormidium nitens TaxID=105231 RepID=A0A0U9HJY6_KLENI|nr:hypothetical protein KFL_001720040 [Klebsormidium nitens]|eukprot:GAQ83991.1 hypothetical protein KFL_001720040 [Klebsormidium nitens]
MAASQLLASALLALCFACGVVAARDSIFVESQETRTVPVAAYNEALHEFEFYNETVEAPRRKALGLGQSAGVTVTFYNSPGMDCTTGNGQCGYGNDVGGNAYGGGGPFVETSLYPYHAASGNYDYLGGCGACGVLSYNGKSRGFVITDITDDDSQQGRPHHIDLCLPSFNYFTNNQAGDGSHGGIFSGTWTRVDCSCMGAPDYPDNAVVVRTQAYNQWAKAVVVSRVGGVGEISSVNFRTRNGGFTSGAKVNGWGTWWMPTGNLGGQGGVDLLITLKDGNSLSTTGYPLPDSDIWQTGQVYNVYQNVQAWC